jgi:chromate transporter
MTPGPIAVNAATFVGLQLAGISGALVATAGCILRLV